METLTMSKKERDRISILERLKRKTISHAAAAAALAISERQLYRIASRVRAEGDAGLIHRLRGHPSNRGRGGELRRTVLALYRQRYADYGPTLFCERLEKVHAIILDGETARRWLIADKQWLPAQRKHRHRKKRERRPATGSLLQFDGSPHDWFEGRGPACTLLHAIDDASGRAFLRFAKSENTIDCMRLMRDYVERYGRPREIYVDFGSVFKDGKTRTQFERAMKDLDIDIIHAHSPQAKGRVERGNRTHQDRLIKAMREAQISSIHKANAFVDRVYLAEHNAQFATTDGLPDVHRSLEGFDLDNIFCLQYERVLANDYTIRLHGSYVQLLTGEAPLPPPRRRVVLRESFDGTLRIFWNEHALAFQQLHQRPRSHKKEPRHLPAQHRWRTQNARLHPARILRKRTKLMTPP